MNDENDSHKKPTLGFGSEAPILYSSPEVSEPESLTAEEEPSENSQAPEKTNSPDLDEDILENPLEHPQMLIGQTINGKYKLTESLGENSLYQTYKAIHVLSGRNFAFRLFNPPENKSVSRAEYLENFRSLVEKLKNISHPNIVSVEDCGIYDFRGYVAADFCVGRTLQQAILDKEVFPQDRLSNLVSQISAGLEVFHEEGLVHKDLNPGNIFLVENEEGHEVAKLLNCGLIDLLSPGEPAAIEPETVLGNPTYLTPEQIQGAPLDKRADVYALGIITYELLAGEPPFLDENVMDLLVSHVKTEPKPPSHTSPERLISTAAESVVLKALSKAPSARQHSVGEFSNELTRSLATQTEDIANPSPEWPNPKPELLTNVEELETISTPDYKRAQTKSPALGRIILFLTFLTFLFLFGSFILWQSFKRIEKDEQIVVASAMKNGTEEMESSPTSEEDLAAIYNIDQETGEESFPSNPEVEDVALAPVEESLTEIPSEPFYDGNSAIDHSSSSATELSVDEALARIAAMKSEIAEDSDDGGGFQPIVSVPTPPTIEQPERVKSNDVPTQATSVKKAKPATPLDVRKAKQLEEKTTKKAPTPIVKEVEFLSPGWYVQVAAKENTSEADAVFNKLSRAGLGTVRQGATVKGVFYNRILVGPLTSIDEAKEVKTRIMREKLHNEVPFIKKSQ